MDRRCRQSKRSIADRCSHGGSLTRGSPGYSRRATSVWLSSGAPPRQRTSQTTLNFIRHAEARVRGGLEVVLPLIVPVS